MIHSVYDESVTFVAELSIVMSGFSFQFSRCIFRHRFVVLDSISAKIYCEMCFNTLAIVLSICQMVKCNWVQIAHTSKEYLEPKNHMLIDRSHFLSTLNHNGDYFGKMENPKVKMNPVNPFHVHRFDSKTNYFEHSIESTKMDNITISASNFTNIADWPDSIRSKNRKINRVNFDFESATTLSPLLNITQQTTQFANDPDFEMSQSESTYQDHSNQAPQDDNIKNAIKQKTFVFKRLEYKPFDFMSVFDFLKNIQKSFLSKGLTAIEDKVKFLENFKDTIMNNIGEMNVCI